MRFVADENFDSHVVTGLRIAMPGFDIIRIQDTEISGRPDPIVLEWAAKEERILLTHDVQTMPNYAYDRVRANLPMPGVIEIAEELSIGEAIAELSIMIGASTADEFENQVKYVPIH